MPAGDRTGPFGTGPRTGRGLGFCSGSGAPGYTAPAFGWGRRFGFGFGARGRGRGRCNWFGAPGGGRLYPWGPSYGAVTREDEIEALSARAAGLERALKAVKGRLAALQRQDKRDDRDAGDE